MLLNRPKFPIADLHCDLLCYLSRDRRRSPYDEAVRCSVSQLRQGNVNVQIMAIFTETNQGSVESGTAQAELFKMLPRNYPEVFEHVRDSAQFQTLPNSNRIGILPAIENASSFCSEHEDLSDGFMRLRSLQHKIGKLSYVSLTWNTENRFGGGALTKVGLKQDGKLLIDFLTENGIALDFSHASDYLAFDILNYIDQRKLPLSVMASHSNFRSVANVPRNLSDDLAKEILQRKGVIGLNFVRPFVGENSQCNFARQLEHGLKMGADKGICFGADFFYTDDVSIDHRKSPDVLYFPSYGNAQCYPGIVELWRKELSIPESMLAHICYDNLTNFLSKKFFPD